MLSSPRTAMVALCAAVVAFGLSGCGGTHHRAANARASVHTAALSVAAADAELPANVVLRIGANQLTKSEFAHWMHVEALLSGSVLPADEEGVREETVEILILRYWVQEEASKAGVRLSRAEEKQANTPSGKLSGSDEALEVGDQLLLEKWHRAVLPVYARLRKLLRENLTEPDAMVNEVHEEIGALNARMTARWTPRTVCRKGYVMYLCSDYHQS